MPIFFPPFHIIKGMPAVTRPISLVPGLSVSILDQKHPWSVHGDAKRRQQFFGAPNSFDRPRDDDPPPSASPGSLIHLQNHTHLRHLRHGDSRKSPPSCRSEARPRPLSSSRRVSPTPPPARCHTKPHTIQATIKLRRGYPLASVQPPRAAVLWLTVMNRCRHRHISGQGTDCLQHQCLSCRAGYDKINPRPLWRRFAHGRREWQADHY